MMSEPKVGQGRLRNLASTAPASRTTIPRANLAALTEARPATWAPLHAVRATRPPGSDRSSIWRRNGAEGPATTTSHTPDTAPRPGSRASPACRPSVQAPDRQRCHRSFIFRALLPPLPPRLRPADATTEPSRRPGPLRQRTSAALASPQTARTHIPAISTFTRCHHTSAQSNMITGSQTGSEWAFDPYMQPLIPKRDLGCLSFSHG